jgi:cytochrome c peroxidase
MLSALVQKKDHAHKQGSKSVRWIAAGALLVISLASSLTIFAGSNLPNPLITSDPSGLLSTYSKRGGINLSNPFFQNLGSNGRSCATCHQPGDAWSVTPAHIQARFYFSSGADPIFRPNDGANCPSADVSSLQARKSSYSLLLKKGLIRVSLPVPNTAEFSITDIEDPYNCPETTNSQPAMYRRPLPSTNLGFLSTVMWDGRETFKGQSMTANLAQQAIDATLGHAQAATAPTGEQVDQIVDFETALYTAQTYDWKAGDLTLQGANGGPKNLFTQPFYIGINDVLGADPNGKPFNPVVFTSYTAWANASGRNAAARQSIARGETLFNTLPITITGVAGLNDLPGLSTINGTCTSCHDTPGVGNHSVSLPISIGTSDYPAMPALDTSGLPIYTIACADGSQKRVTDIGRAMITGRCADVGKLKGPVLRGLAGRAPYFHNGGAKTLENVVEFYDQRFGLHLSALQKHDLVAFLKTL